MSISFGYVEFVDDFGISVRSRRKSGQGVSQGGADEKIGSRGLSLRRLWWRDSIKRRVYFEDREQRRK